ncbi:MAG: recombinase family protein [Aeromonadaceae bacterium]
MIFGYARVSTDQQELDLQMDALKAAGVEDANIITDVMSGTKAERPGLARLLDKCREGDTVVVWRLDRLGRSLSNLIQLVEDLSKRGIFLRSLHEAIDMSTPTGKLTLHLFLMLAEYERSVIHQRTLAGLQAARERGRVGGRPSALTDEQKGMARTLYRSGEVTIKALCDQFGCGRATMYRLLKEESQ